MRWKLFGRFSSKGNRTLDFPQCPRTSQGTRGAILRRAARRWRGAQEMGACCPPTCANEVSRTMRVADCVRTPFFALKKICSLTFLLPDDRCRYRSPYHPKADIAFLRRCVPMPAALPEAPLVRRVSFAVRSARFALFVSRVQPACHG